MERTPVKTIPIHEHLRPRLCDTYENDSIFDKFEVVFSGDAKNVMTGSYNNNFMIYPSDPEKDTEVVLQADKSAFKAKKVGIPTPMNSSTSPTGSTSKKGGSRAGSPAAGAVGQGQRMRKETDADQIDFNKKILHMSWHPFEDSIAIAATNNVGAPDLILTNTPLTILSYSSSLLCEKSDQYAHIWPKHSQIEAFTRVFLVNHFSLFLLSFDIRPSASLGSRTRLLNRKRRCCRLMSQSALRGMGEERKA
jgi:hypothetical protein